MNEVDNYLLTLFDYILILFFHNYLMKYSITCSNLIPQAFVEHPFGFKRSYSNYLSTTTLEITPENTLGLSYFRNRAD
jgi:hypothetical protein